VRNRIARLNLTARSTPPSIRTRTVRSNNRSAAGWQHRVGGGFTSIGGQTRHNIARLDATTGLADSFNPGRERYCQTIAAGGWEDFGGRCFPSIGGQMRNKIARLDATTGLADSFTRIRRWYQYQFNRGAGGRQDFSSWPFHQHRPSVPQ
jgi:hypothetical protein